MIKITVGNSESKIEGLLVNDFKKLKDLLSYTLNPTASYFAGRYGPRKQSLLTAKGVFPTGLLYLTLGYLKSNKIPFGTNDLRQVPKRQEGLFTLALDRVPYIHQVEAAKSAIKAQRGIVVAPTGVGKSLILALMIEGLKVPTLVIVPSLELKRQLTQTLSVLFSVHVVGDDKPIYVENIDALRSKKRLKTYDAVIIDEFHHSGAKTYRKVNKTLLSGTFYKFGLTATPFRSQDHEKLLLESVLSEVCASVSYKTAVREKYIVPMEAYYVDVPKTPTTGANWHKVFSELIVENEKRNKIIVDIIQMLKAQNRSTLCLVKEIRHGELLSNLSTTHFANGESEDTPDLITFFNSNAITSLIGTNGVLGEGVDTKPAEFIIITGLGKSKNAFMQQCGRGFRNYHGKESCKIILFKDLSHKWTREHYKAQCKILLEEYGVVPQQLIVD